MANPALGFQGAIAGIGEEGTYGTPVTVTKFAGLNSDGLSANEDRIHSGAIPTIFTDDDEMAQGAINCAGDLGFEMRYQGHERWLKHAMGAVVSAEVASFTVGASNNKLDFNIGAGPLVATISSGTYKMGVIQTDAGSLCKAIYDAIVAAEGTGVYTVTYSLITSKVTITKSSGTLSLLWNTGASTLVSIGSLIGYALTADDTGALTYTGDTALTAVYDHTFTLIDALPIGLTVEIDRDIKAFTFQGSKLNTLQLGLELNNFLMASFGVIAQDAVAGIPTAATLPTAPLIIFSQGAIQYGGSSANVKSCSLQLNNQLSTDRRFIGSRKMSEPMRNAKIEVTGTIQVEFDSIDKFDDFRAATSRALILTCTGVTSSIKTGFTYALTVNVPLLKLTGTTPTVKGVGVLLQDCPFKAYAQDSSTREFNIVIRNSLSSV